MFIYIKDIKKKLIILFCFLTTVLIGIIIKANHSTKTELVIGAFIHVGKEMNCIGDTPEGDLDSYYESNERFLRPSKLPAIEFKFELKKRKGDEKLLDDLPVVYQSSKEVVEAYYRILREASFMSGYSGGCGTILGYMNYTYAYELLSSKTKELLSYDNYHDSFKGTGATALLHLMPAFQPPDTPHNIESYFVEVEVLKGHPYQKGKYIQQPNYFEYYYGVVETIYDEKEGWKIQSVNYLPEVYLCHPLHGWSYDYSTFMGVVYNNWYNMDLTFYGDDINNNVITVYGKNKNNDYRFEFVRLTNGTDVLLHEYKKVDGQWQEVTLLKPDVLSTKLSILTFDKEKHIQLTSNND